MINGMQEYFDLERKGYFGGKGAGGVIHKIANQIPRHKERIIGFAGLCAVTRLVKPADKMVLHELDAEIVKMWKDASLGTSHNISILQKSFLDVMKPQEWTNDTYVYLDPPYPWKSRKSKARYNYEMTDKEHGYLIDEICDAGGNIAISSYENEIYEKGLSNWRQIRFKAMTRSGKMATEVLYMNYPKPTQLHDYSFIGPDRSEREKMTRRHRNAIRKFEKMDVLERNKLLSELQRLYPNIAAG